MLKRLLMILALVLSIVLLAGCAQLRTVGKDLAEGATEGVGAAIDDFEKEYADSMWYQLLGTILTVTGGGYYLNRRRNRTRAEEFDKLNGNGEPKSDE